MRLRVSLALAFALAWSPVFGQATNTTTTVPKGGTGRGTLTNHGVVFGAGANPVTLYACTGFLIGTGSSADPLCRALTGADLPAPSSSSLGGIQSVTCPTSQWVGSISTLGVPSCSQPAASDLSNGVTGSGAVTLATSPAFAGTPTAPTAAVDTSTTQLATTAFVAGQAAAVVPLVDAASAAVGTSLRYARADHVHPTDTSRAPLASPGLTGTPTAPTAAVDTNTTQLATAAFVLGQAAAVLPLIDGTAAIGSSTRYARADHVHPIDTSRAPVASPTFTGTPAAPTATADTSTTQLATTAFVIGQAASATPLINGTAAAGTSGRYARADHVHPTDTTRAPSSGIALSALTSQANNTFVGNVSGLSASPVALTQAQATGALNAMVGDTGSGGTKGLVPAPSAGDASGGKYLKADGTWAAPAGGGGGGSLSDTDRRNILLDRVYASKLFAGYRRVLSAFADGYKASDGISSGSSSNYALDTTNGRVAPTATSGSSPSYANTGGTGNRSSSITATASASLFSQGTPPNLVDGSYAGGSGDSIVFNSSFAVSSSVFLKFDFGASVSKVITEVTIRNAGAQTYGNWKWRGSNDDSTYTDIGSSFTLGGSTTQTDTTMASNSSGWRYYKLEGVSGTGASSPNYVEEFEFKIDNYSVGTINNMTLITTAQTAEASVSNGRVLMEVNPVSAITLNTDLTAEVTCNGGTNWASATLSSSGTGQGGRSVVETADTTCTSGTSFAARIKTLNNKNVQIYGTSLTVH